MPSEAIGASNATQGYWGVKCHPRLLGRQMPPEVIGASNATWGYWGVKCHPEVIGASKAQGSQKAGASKGPIAAGRQKPQGVRVQGVKIRASGFTSSNVPGVKGDESLWLKQRLSKLGISNLCITEDVITELRQILTGRILIKSQKSEDWNF